MIAGTDEERRQFRREQDRLVWQHLRWGVAGGMLFCIALVVVLPLSYPSVPRGHLIVPPLIAFAALILAGLGRRIDALAPRPNAVVMPLGIVVATCTGWVSAYTGGFSSPLYFMLLIVWIFGSTVLALSPTAFLVDIIPQLLLATAVIIGLGAARAEDLSVPLLVSLGALAFCILGGILRDRAAFEAFLTRTSLDRARADLADLNRDLERRVQEAVAQVHEKVQERSRELAIALERLAKSAPPRSESLAAGHMLGDRIEIIRPLGAGGMGAVYLATDHLTGARVAVKVLHAGSGSEPDALRRFVAEAAAAAAIIHPGVVRTIHVDVTADGRLYHIMEYVEGATLARVLDTTPTLPSPTVARLGAVVANALAAAHRASVIHRDVKPSNLIITRDAPGIRILDFGVSKLGTWHTEQLTATHETLGTPEFMAPEQVVRSASVTALADVYSLGVVLFRALTGELPFPNAFVAAHGEHNAPVAAGDADLAALIARCLSRTPTDRPFATELAGELTSIADRLAAPSAEALAKTLLGEGETVSERKTESDTVAARPISRPVG